MTHAASGWLEVDPAVACALARIDDLGCGKLHEIVKVVFARAHMDVARRYCWTAWKTSPFSPPLLASRFPLIRFRNTAVTNDFSTEYGRASGGVVNVASKPGTNDFHGSAWEFNRLSAYTANTFADVASGLPKGKYTRNQFGFRGGRSDRKELAPRF
jgi:hypothetical protein